MPMGEDPRHGLLVALVVALVLVLLLIFAALTVAPALVIVLGLMTYVVWWYVSREDTSFMHHAQEHENRFWTTVAFCVSGAFVFVHDSPVAVGQWSPVLGFLFVMIFTFSVHSYDRQLHRSRIGRTPNIRRSIESSTLIHSSVQDKCRRISVCLSKLDNRLVATNLNHMLWADMVQNLEKEIVTILSDAEPAELNYMLPKIGLGLLFYKVKDHVPLNLHRTMLLDLLAVSRISVLNVTSRALVLDALQKMKLSAHRKSEHYAKNIILKTKGDELSELKSLTDAKGDIHSMHKLTFQDIKDSTIREEVLKHIATQAKVQAAHMKLRTKVGSRRSEKAWRKILSDVDDTLTSSGGRFPAGVDRRYPRKSVYPGVLDFYREMDLGVNGPSEWPNGQVGNLVFLSARPHVYKDMSESTSYAKFKRLQDEKGLYTSPTLLAGSLDTGKTMMLTGNMEPVAEKKFQNFAEYVSLYPEFKHVFVGDNGQGDVRAAEMMAERYPNSLEAVYMQRVVPEEKTFGYQGAETRQAWKSANIFFFDDYVEAACHAYKHGLIQAVGLQRVCQGAVQQFVDMTFDGPLERELQRRQINQSCCKANKLLQAADLEPNWLIRAVRAFDNMEAVLTPFGRGIVVHFRPEDGVYEVLLDWSQNAAAESSASKRSSSVKIAASPVTPLQGGRPHSNSMHSPVPTPLAAHPPRATSFPATSSTAASILSTASSPAAPNTPAAGAGATAGLAATAGPATARRTPVIPSPAGAPPSATMPSPAGALSSAASLPLPPESTAALAGPSAFAPVAAAAVATASAGAGSVPSAAPPAAAAAAGTGRALSPATIMMPQRGPDAAGGGEVLRDARVRRTATAAMMPGETTSATTTATATATNVAATATATAAMTAAVRSANGAEEAAGAPAPAVISSAGARGGGDGGGGGGGGGVFGEETPPAAVQVRFGVPGEERQDDEEMVPAAVAVANAAAEAVERSGAQGSGGGGGEGERGADLGRSPGEVSVSSSKGDSVQLVPWVEETWPPPDGNTTDGKPSGVQEDSVVTTAAKALKAHTPGSFAVCAYLQLPSLKKAPPEVKKPSYKDESGDQPKSNKRSGRLSMFRSGQDSSVGAGTGDTRSPAKVVIAKGTVVQTFMGLATVRNVRSADGMSEVSFHKWNLGNGKPAFGVLRTADLVPDLNANTVGKSPSLFGRTGKAISSLFKLSTDPTATTSTAVSSLAPPEPRAGDIVDTLFGPAAITAVRGRPVRGIAPAPLRPPTPSTPVLPTMASATGAGVVGVVATVPAEDVSVVMPAFSGVGDGAGAEGGEERAGGGGGDNDESRSARPTSPVDANTSGAVAGIPAVRSDVSLAPVLSPTTPTKVRTRPPAPTPPRPPSENVPPGIGSSVSGVSGPSVSSASRLRPRSASLSATGSSGISHSSSAVVAATGGEGELGAQLSSRGAGVLLPGKLYSPLPVRSAGVGSAGNERGGGSAPPSPAAAADASAMEGMRVTGSAGVEVDSDDEENGGDASSPLGIRILEERGVGGRGGRGGGASPADAVLYEVAFMKWRLANNTPARAVLNRSSIWADWEKRPPGVGSTRGRRSSARRATGKRSSRPSSFFGFMSMVGGLGSGGGTTKVISPSNSPQKSRSAKSPAKSSQKEKPLHRCDFQPGVCVRTSLGPALVVKFRPVDGIYQVSLLSWVSQSGGLASAYLNRTSITSAIAVPGSAVRTFMGLGTVELVREDSVVVVVAISGGGSGGDGKTPATSADRTRARGQMTLFLQLASILGSAKATVGERVGTRLGSGVLRTYSTRSDTYTVDLGWGLLHSPQGSAISERMEAAASNPLSSRSAVGIIKLFRWPLFGGGSSAAVPFAV